MLKPNSTYRIKYRQSINEPFVSVYVSKHTVKYCLSYCIGNTFLKDFHYVYNLSNPCQILFDGFYFNEDCSVINEIIKELDKYKEYFTLRKNNKASGGILLEIIYKDEKIEDLISYFMLIGEIENFEECKDRIKPIK